MVKDEFELLNNEILTKAKAVRVSKGTDYQRTSEDILFNFKDAEGTLGLDRIKAVGWALKEQMDAIYTFIKTNKLESESIESRIVDSINYLLIFNAVMKENNKEGEDDNTHE